MNISLVIPAYNEEKQIGLCLKRVTQNAPQNLLEIIVVNNASTDNTEEIAKRFPKVRVVYEGKKGLTKARQRGLDEAKGDLLAYIDADTRMPKGWFSIVNKEFKKNDNLICLSGPYYYFDLPRWQKYILRWLYKYIFRPTYYFTGSLVIGGNFVVKRDSLIKIGGFDESIPFYGEDSDLARRLKKVGKVLFSNEFYMMTSGRRLIEEGFFMTGFKYIMNFVWEFLFHKPFNKKYRDVRI